MSLGVLPREVTHFLARIMHAPPRPPNVSGVRNKRERTKAVTMKNDNTEFIKMANPLFNTDYDIQNVLTNAKITVF
jgi:hypothetical protein